jgi:hypothetical protein
MRFYAFGAAVCLLTIALALIRHGALLGDPFSTEVGSETLVRISLLPPFDMASAKFRHAVSVPKFDVGIFGNSRSVAVGVNELRLGDLTAFNFSIPGTSMRQSVALVERLESRGAAPRVVVISLDNIELQNYDNAYYPGPRTRLKIAADDAYWAIGNESDGRLLTLAHIVLDYLYGEWAAFTTSWSATASWVRVAAAAPGIVSPLTTSVRTSYLRDGSRPIKELSGIPILIHRPEPFILFWAYMARDLRRLAALRLQGHRIIIYESHMDPASAVFVASKPSAAIEALRKQFLGACAKLDLECYPAVTSDLPVMQTAWHDCCHPPPDSLGVFISTIVARQARQ